MANVIVGECVGTSVSATDSPAINISVKAQEYVNESAGNVAKATVSVSDDETASIEIGNYTRVVERDAVIYPGTYNVTPSQSVQQLNTSGYKLEQNVVINPIPSNYGRIEWNGTELMII